MTARLEMYMTQRNKPEPLLSASGCAISSHSHEPRAASHVIPSHAVEMLNFWSQETPILLSYKARTYLSFILKAA